MERIMRAMYCVILWSRSYSREYIYDNNFSEFYQWRYDGYHSYESLKSSMNHTRSTSESKLRNTRLPVYYSIYCDWIYKITHRKSRLGRFYRIQKHPFDEFFSSLLQYNSTVHIVLRVRKVKLEILFIRKRKKALTL